MNFKDWMINEVQKDISKLPFHNVDLHAHEEPEPFEEEEFDSHAAREECEEDHDFDQLDISEFGTFYSSPNKDPEFKKIINHFDWKREPKPKRYDFETQTEFDKAYDAWQQLDNEITREYEEELDKWEQENQKNLEDAQEKAQDYYDRIIDNCVWEKEQHHNSLEEKRRQKYDDYAAKYPPGYHATFSLFNQDFTVSMTKQNEQFENIILDDIYEITFKGRYDYLLTRQHTGAEASIIYNHLIASIIKMVQEEEAKGNKINGFFFSAADKNMITVYNRFYLNYLKPHGYMQIGSFYLHKDYIRQVKKSLSPAANQELMKNILLMKRHDRQTLQKAQEQKSDVRNKKIFLSQNKGRVVLFKLNPFSQELEPGIILGFDPSKSSVYAIIAWATDDGTIAKISTEYNDIVFSQEPTQKQIDNIITNFADKEEYKNYPEFRKFLTKHHSSLVSTVNP